MPNGHGGYLFLGGPVLFGILFAVFAALPLRERMGWGWVAICLAFAALAGWRLAYHRHMRHADAYDGAYTSPDEHRRAARRYCTASAIYAVIAVTLGFGILWWRGLP